MDGLYRQLTSVDLFPTAIAIRLLLLLKLGARNGREILASLKAHARNGAVSVAPGGVPDRWAAAQALTIQHGLTQARDDLILSFLREGETPGGGIRLMDGASPEVWVTAFAIDHLAKNSNVVGLNREDTIAWLLQCQHPDGGFCWSPAHVERGDYPDLRSTFLAVKALRHLGADEIRGALPEEVGAWVLAQSVEGGYRLNPNEKGACVWSTRFAVRALQETGHAYSTREQKNHVDWILAHQRADGGWRRGDAYVNLSETWSTYYAIDGIVNGLGGLTPPSVHEAAARFVRGCELGRHGFSDHPTRKAEAISTSGMSLIGETADPARSLAYLRDCAMPEEGGFGFCPARGTEARSTQWIVQALSAAGDDDFAHVSRWARQAQNPDGGFGIFTGLGSSTSATCAVVTALSAAGCDLTEIDIDGAKRWLGIQHARALRDGQLLDVADTTVALRTLGADVEGDEVRRLLEESHLDGGWRRRSRMPADLVTTYRVLMAYQAMGELHGVIAGAAGFVTRLHLNDGVAWTERSPADGGLLARVFAALIQRGSEGRTLPNLNL